MSIGDIARRTFIQPKFLQAIDADDFSTIPQSHHKLFVREYAKIVGVDPNELFPELESYSPPAEIPVEVPPPVEAGAATPAATPPTARPRSDEERKAYRDVLNRLSRGRGVKLSGPNTSSWLIGGAVLLLVLGALYYFLFRKQDVESSAKPLPTDSTAQTGLLSDSTSGGAPVPGTSDPAAGDSLTLEGRANSKVWFSVVMDGKRSDTGTLDSGHTRTWRAIETFKLSLGNAGGLELALNEKPLGTLGPKQSIARNQIIDANGIRRGAVRRTAAATNRSRPTTPKQTPPAEQPKPATQAEGQPAGQ
jgi:cytoskeletal protein RodZ